jgi:hypothetical protein
MMRSVNVDEPEYFLNLTFVKNQITSLEHILKFQNIKGPRVVSVKLFENVMDLKISLSFSFIEEIFFGKATWVTLLKPLKGLMIL